MKATQKILKPAAIYNGRPPNLTGPPVFVYHPVFAKFVSQIRMDDICELLAQYHDTEPAMQSAIRPLFEWFFGLQISDPRRSTLLKLGIGSGGCDPIDQGEKDYQLCCMNPNLDAIRQRSPMPAFLFSLVGPIFCISGLIFVNNRVVSQRLMDYQCFIPLLTYDPGSSRTFRPNEIHVARIAQKLRSLSRCLDELDDYYGSITPKQPTGLMTPVAQQRAIFLADATTGEETVSCVAAHEHMFQRKAAPRLLYCSREPSAGLLFVVVMEFIKGTLRDSPAAYDRNKIEDLESAVRSLHDQNVRGALLLVDFDWSGELNVVRYPLSLNPDPKMWAPGVTRGL
ncbi:hypothetical protein B0H13DRAFT_1975929 [Mycena leptocephala]|nr:hypothetical protein B0H13DRAFT_1975929 [Mycena leptocephala]